MEIKFQSLLFPPAVVCGSSSTAAVTGSGKDSPPYMKVDLMLVGLHLEGHPV